jgi:hypothetical protein
MDSDSEFQLICEGLFLPWDVSSGQAKAAASAKANQELRRLQVSPTKKAKSSPVLKRPAAAEHASESDPIEPCVSRREPAGKGPSTAGSGSNGLPFFPAWQPS